MEDRILANVRKAKKYLSESKYDQAKDCFLDGAQLAVEFARTHPNEEDKYKKIATQLIALAKEAKESDDMISLQADIDKSFPRVPHESSDIKKTSDRNMINLDFLLDYPFDKQSQEIRIVMGQGDEQEVFWEPHQLMNGIMMVTGGSGSGKTEWLKSLISEFTLQGYPSLVLDLHGDMEVDIPTVTIDYNTELGINPLELLSKSEAEGGPMPQINRVLEVLDDAVEDGFSSTQKAYLRSILQFTYETHGIFQQDPKSWHRIAPDFSFIKNMLIKPDEVLNPQAKNRYIQEILAAKPTTINAVKNRLLPILEHPAFSANSYIPVEYLLTKPLRINLKPLGTISNQFIAADTLLRQVFQYLKSLGHIGEDGKNDKFRLFVIIDEVKILSGFRGRINDNYHILNQLATEARKFGMGLILASQIIGHFGRDIRANSASKIILRPMDSQEARQVAKEMEISSDLVLDLNTPGLSYFKSTSIDEPIKIQLYPLSKRKTLPSI